MCASASRMAPACGSIEAPTREIAMLAARILVLFAALAIPAWIALQTAQAGL